MLGKAIINTSPRVIGIRNIKTPLMIVFSETSSPTSPLVTKMLVPTGGVTIPIMQRVTTTTPNQMTS